MRHHRWHPVASVESGIPETHKYWIHLPDSLTAALRRRSRDLSVQVLEERFLQADTAMPLLGVSAGGRCWSRKVCLRTQYRRWVAAHTLVPAASLERQLADLSRLNNRPLGELLFTTPGVTRDSLEVASTPLGWARRTRYRLAGQPLLVAEFFLDDLIHDEHRRLSALPETDPA